MALATLSIDLVAQIASLQEGMDKAGRLAEKQAAEIEARYARMADTARSVGAALGGAISVAGLAAWFKTTADGLDALNDLKDATGASIENISALEDIAARTGTSMETVSSALVKMNKALAEATPDSGIERTLRAIGLSADELRRIDPAEALMKTAQALAGFADDGNKARLAGELFGKSWKEVAPLLNDLAENGKLVATVTAEQAAEAEKFNKQLTDFQKNAQDAARTFVSQLLPALNQFFDAVRGKDTGGQGPISALITVPLQTAAIVGSDVAFVMRGIGTEIGGIAAQLASLARLDFKGFKFIGDAMKADAADARKELDAFQARVMAIGNVREAGAGRGFINPPVIKPGVPTVPGKPDKPVVEKEVVDESTRALAAYVKQLQDGIAKTEDLSERVKALDVLKSLGVKGEIPQVRELVLGLADELDLREKGLEFARAMTAELERQKSAQAGLDDELARYAGRLDEARKISLTTRLEERLAAGEQFSPEELDRIVKGIGGIKEQVVELDEFSKNFAESVQQNLGETLRLTLSGSFDDIAKLWGNMLLRMATDAVAADLARSLFPSLGKAGTQAGTSVLGSAISNYLGGFSGFIGSLFGGGRATGGGVSAGGLYQVAEGGRPELLQVGGQTMLLMGKQGGQVVPARAATGGAAGGITVVQHMSFSSGANPAELAAWGQRVKAETIAAVADAQRRQYRGAPA